LKPNRKLTTEEKLQLLKLSGKMSLRELAEKFGLHHSSVDEIIKESEKLLAEYWDEKSKRVGRPKKEISPEDKKVQELEKELKSQKTETAKAEMTLDYYKLVMKQKGIEDPYEKKPKHFKKKKKKN